MGDCSMHMTKMVPFPGTTQRSAWEGCFLWQGDEGFEPPQTESESGVLPLHKSPCILAPRRNNVYYYTQNRPNVKKKFLILPGNFSAAFDCAGIGNLV